MSKEYLLILKIPEKEFNLDEDDLIRQIHNVHIKSLARYCPNADYVEVDMSEEFAEKFFNHKTVKQAQAACTFAVQSYRENTVFINGVYFNYGG